MSLLAIHLLWLNLVTDGIQDAALTFEKAEDGITNEKPRDTNEKIFNRLLLEETLLAGFSIGIIVFIFLTHLIDNLGLDIEHARSILAKLDLVLKYNLEGVSYWTIDRKYPQNYLILNSLFNITKE
jgi:magnesium-transporting ATPase (P-type)